jgi:hypothetical protein
MAGSNSATKMPIMEITTSNSIKVNPFNLRWQCIVEALGLEKTTNDVNSWV